MENHPHNNLDDFCDLIPPFYQRGMDLGLDRIKCVLKEMGNPCMNIPAIQIVGTNGKGSIATFLKSVLLHSNIKAGVSTSPHLMSWCERISTNGIIISPQELREHLIALKPLAEGVNLTPFELLIAASFRHFAAQNVEILVLEVGLGGRLDATTAHSYRPLIAMGSIGLDHCEHLGESLKEITYEKASVITNKSTIVSAQQHPEATKVLQEIATKKHANIKWVRPLNKDWKLGIIGDVQRENAAVAKGILEELAQFGWQLSEQKIRNGLAVANWPGRLQSMTWGKLPLLIDCAHNPPAAERLSKEREKWSFQSTGIQWILGIQSHKKGPEILRILMRQNDLAWIIPIPGYQSWERSQLSKACPKLSKQIFQEDGLEKVLLRLKNKGEWPNPPPVITGSIYLIGHLLKEKVII